MDRRSFLLGAGALTVSQLLAGCDNQQRTRLHIELLKGSIPVQVVNSFRSTVKQPADIKFAPVKQISNVFTQLQSWNQRENAKIAPDSGRSLPLPWDQAKPNIPPNLVTLGDYWLVAAIAQKLIQPIDPTQLQQWSSVPNRWQELVRRNENGYLDAQGQVWAAPYRWGNTIIAYNRDKFRSLDWTPKDWSDLWREEVRDRISLLDHPREVIGLTLKKLGRSYNTEKLEEVSDLEKQLYSLDQQVKFYSSDTYLQPLIMGDTWLAVGWSTDVLPIMQRYQQIEAVIPQSGTAIWADLWVNPVGSTAITPLVEQWIDFCWQPQIAKQISLLSKANSPIPVELKPTDINQRLRNLLLSDPQIFDRSEFLLPLSEATAQQYQSLWQKIRT